MSALRRIIMITDSRIGSALDGSPASSDAALSGYRWKRGLESIEGLEYAVRVDPKVGSGAHPISGVVHPLPYYVGIRQFLLRAPRIVVLLWRLIGSADTVVTRLPGVIASLSIVIASLRRRQIALEVAGDIEAALVDGHASTRSRVLGVLARVLTQILVKRGRAVRYVTQRALQEKYPPAPFASVVAFSSVSLADWEQPQQASKSSHPSIVAVGTHQRLYKGHDLLIGAMPALLAEFSSLELTLVGDGDLHNHLIEFARSEGVSESVCFAGYVGTRQELMAMIDEAWVYAIPSRTEGLPRSLIEAMSRGVACVGSDVGGIPELLSTDQLVPSNDLGALEARLLELLSSESERARLGSLNLARAEAFRPEALANAAQRWSNLVTGLS